MNIIYDKFGGDIYAKVEVKALAEEAIKTNQRKVIKKLRTYEDSVVCDINGLRDILTEEQFDKMEIIFQISMNTALVQSGFSYIHVSNVMIEGECLVENNVCVNPTDTINATDTSNATDAGRMLSRRSIPASLRFRRVIQRIRSGRCGAYCPRRPLRSDIANQPSRQLEAKAPKEAKATKEAKAPKEAKDLKAAPEVVAKDLKAAPEVVPALVSKAAPKVSQFIQPKYNSFFEETVSKEYANNLRTQEDLLADKLLPSEVNTYCRLLKDFLQE
eukprot:scaffold61103_cov38-Attheya_sp.AAC.6